METLEPSVALATCENALRGLMEGEYARAFGDAWLERVSTPKQRLLWSERQATEVQARRGVAEVRDVGLAYSNFYDLLTIADKNWEPLAAALGKKKASFPLLERFESLRNTIGHSRPLVTFERELLSGIAGQIRNQVTIHRSSRDPVGDIYPRIESISDGFGRTINSSGVSGEIAGSTSDPEIVVRPGASVTFLCFGVDPADRRLKWSLKIGNVTNEVVVDSGAPANLVWTVTEEDVRETANVEIYMQSETGRYRRYGYFDHRAYFGFVVRPPHGD